MKRHCDYGGNCKCKAYAEVYPALMAFASKKDKNFADAGWSYLCKKHYAQEQKRYGSKLPAWIIKNKKRKAFKQLTHCGDFDSNERD